MTELTPEVFNGIVAYFGGAGLILLVLAAIGVRATAGARLLGGVVGAALVIYAIIALSTETVLLGGKFMIFPPIAVIAMIVAVIKGGGKQAETNTPTQWAPQQQAPQQQWGQQPPQQWGAPQQQWGGQPPQPAPQQWAPQQGQPPQGQPGYPQQGRPPQGQPGYPPHGHPPPPGHPQQYGR